MLLGTRGGLLPHTPNTSSKPYFASWNSPYREESAGEHGPRRQRSHTNTTLSPPSLFACRSRPHLSLATVLLQLGGWMDDLADPALNVTMFAPNDQALLQGTAQLLQPGRQLDQKVC